MVTVNIIGFFIDNILFLFLFVVNIVFSIPVGHIDNTIFVASVLGQSFSNITCNQCTCI
jgi:hypothetical protein